MASLRVGRRLSSNNLQVKSAARHTSIPGARASEGQERYGDTPTDPRLEHRTKSEKKTGWMLHQNLAVWSVRACHHLSSRQFISTLFTPSKMKPKAQQTLAPATPPPPLPTAQQQQQRQKQKTIKTHQSPPSSAEHAAVPPRPSAAAAHGAAHVDGNAAASFLPCLPKTQPLVLLAAAQFVASFASHRDPSRAVRLPASRNRIVVSGSAVGVESLAGASIRVVVLWDWLLWWWSRETKILAALPWLRRAPTCCGRMLVAGR